MEFVDVDSEMVVLDGKPAMRVRGIDKVVRADVAECGVVEPCAWLVASTLGNIFLPEELQCDL